MKLMRKRVSEESAASKMKVELDAVLARDLDVVNAARVSLNQESDELSEKDIGLINFLMKNGHGTPFEHGYFRFRVEVPIFVAREWFRHRIGHSYNEWSGRYSEIETNFFRPEKFRTQVGKPGAYSFENIEGSEKGINDILSEVEVAARDAYKELLSLGVAKEQARMVLPVSIYTKFIWSCNPRSLMHFLSLRTSEHAMKEIRDCALTAECFFKDAMPYTHDAWVKAGKKAP